MGFETWWQRLSELAFDAEWELGEPDSYREYYDDGDSPEDTLALEMSYVGDDYDDDYDDENPRPEVQH